MSADFLCLPSEHCSSSPVRLSPASVHRRERYVATPVADIRAVDVGQLDHLDPGAVGKRARIVRRLSGFTSEELRHRLNSRWAGLVTQLERGELRVIERISEIANACAGEWVLREATPEQIARFLYFERDDLPVTWPFSEGS